MQSQYGSPLIALITTSVVGSLGKFDFSMPGWLVVGLAVSIKSHFGV